MWLTDLDNFTKLLFFNDKYETNGDQKLIPNNKVVFAGSNQFNFKSIWQELCLKMFQHVWESFKVCTHSSYSTAGFGSHVYNFGWMRKISNEKGIRLYSTASHDTNYGSSAELQQLTDLLSTIKFIPNYFANRLIGWVRKVKILWLQCILSGFFTALWRLTEYLWVVDKSKAQTAF